MPRLAANLREINGLISAGDIAEVRGDWNGACDRMYGHARRRIKEIDRVARIHRDPFEPILTVLELHHGFRARASFAPRCCLLRLGRDGDPWSEEPASADRFGCLPARSYCSAIDRATASKIG